MKFFRIQQAGIRFDEMADYDSEDGGDGYTDGLCVGGRPDEFGGAWDAYDDDDGEVVVMDGRILEEIYDGYRIRPTKEIARFTKGQWREMMRTGEVWNYE